MDSFMLNTHHNYPERVFPGDRQSEWQFINQGQDHCFDFIPIVRTSSIVGQS